MVLLAEKVGVQLTKKDNPIKLIALAILTFGCWFAVIYFLYKIFYFKILAGGALNTFSFGGLVISSALLMALLAVDSYITLKFSFPWIIFALIIFLSLLFVGTLTPLMVFPSYVSYFVAGGIIVFLCFILARFRIKDEAETLLKVSFSRTAGRGFRLLIWGFFLLITFAFYFSPKIQDISPYLTVENVFKLIEKPVAVGARLWYPDFSFDMKVEDFAKLVIGKSIEEQVLRQIFLARPELKAMPAETFQKLKEQALNEIIFQQVKELAQKYNLDLKGGESIGEVLIKLARPKLVTLVGILKPYLPMVAVAILLIVFWIFATPFRWLVGFFSWILFEIFLAAGFVALGKEWKEREYVILK